MANSEIVSKIKDRIIKDMINNDTLVAAIDATECEEPSDLVNSHIFRYNQNPNTVQTSTTLITIMVHTRSRDKQERFVTPTIELWIYSTNSHMNVTNIPGITDNRNDYISRIIDDMLNGESKYGGFGELRLAINEEGVLNKDFLYRRMVFSTIDLNDSMCGN